MSFSTLRERLRSLSSQIRPIKELEKFNPKSGFYEEIVNWHVDNSDGLVEQIVEVFSTIPQLSPYNEGRIRSSPTSTGSVHWSSIANWLLAQARLRSADEVVTQLEESVSLDSAPMSEVIVLWGLHPTSPMKLTHDIYLVPITDLIPSRARDSVTGIDPNLSVVGTFFPGPRCTAAIKRDFLHTGILDKGEGQSIPSAATMRMKEIVKCLCLINDRPVCELASWYECPLSTPIIGGVPGWGGQAVEHTFQFLIDPVNYDEISARSIVERFLNFTDSERQRLYIPLSRLNTALRSTDNADKALDLGIAIESLLGAGQDDISYKVRQRGTLLLGGTSNEKHTTFEHLKKLYALRSKVAHGSTLSSTVTVNGRAIPTDQFLKECCIICARMIRKVIESGFVSDWDGLLIGW
jgi:Apea-like HEPN